MRAAPQIRLECLTPAQIIARASAGPANLFGLILQGDSAASVAAQLPAAIPHLDLNFPVLPASPEQVWGETWFSEKPLLTGRHRDVQYSCNNDLLFGTVSLDEAAFAALPGGPSPLRQATETAYRQIFALLDQSGFPELLRVWNYFSDINGQSFGIERYRQFNIGRYEAFRSCRRPTSGRVPAACALGTRGGPLCLAFLAGRRPLLALENPRQLSAYHYPADYGPRSPTFSRAGLVRLPDQEILLISGTASIIGHRTLHHGDALAQARESLTNVAAIIDEANRVGGHRDYAPQALTCKVYIRHAGDFAAVRQAMTEFLGQGDSAQVMYVLADICRADLLVEIEAGAARYNKEMQ
jgi:enamine deaminase RidA (YjgF/YER057c/UK114 family)